MFLFAPNPDAPFFMNAPITTLIVAVTVYVSYRAFNNFDIYNRFIFNPIAVERDGEWARFFLSGLIHADWAHLAFNMITLYTFGEAVEMTFNMLFGVWGSALYISLYVLGLPASALFSFFKHRYDPNYLALGASGAISGVVFSFIVLSPTSTLQLLFFPIPMPAVVFGALYLFYCSYMSQRNLDNIGHDAHFWGSIWGAIFTLMLSPMILNNFLNKISTLF